MPKWDVPGLVRDGSKTRSRIARCQAILCERRVEVLSTTENCFHRPFGRSAWHPVGREILDDGALQVLVGQEPHRPI